MKLIERIQNFKFHYFFQAFIISILYSSLSLGKLFWAIPLGPAFLAWKLLDKKISFWSKAGLSVVVAYLVSLTGIVFQTLVNSISGNVIHMCWIIIPMAIALIGIKKLNKEVHQPWFKVILIAVIWTIVCAGIEKGLMSALVKNFNEYNSISLMKNEYGILRFLLYPAFVYLPSFSIMLYLSSSKKKGVIR